MADDNALRVLFDFIDPGLSLLYASYESGRQECQKEDLLTIAEEILTFSVLIETIHHAGSALANSMQEWYCCWKLRLMNQIFQKEGVVLNVLLIRCNLLFLPNKALKQKILPKCLIAVDVP